MGGGAGRRRSQAVMRGCGVPGGRALNFDIGHALLDSWTGSLYIQEIIAILLIAAIKPHPNVQYLAICARLARPACAISLRHLVELTS